MNLDLMAGVFEKDARTRLAMHHCGASPAMYCKFKTGAEAILHYLTLYQKTPSAPQATKTQ